MGDVPPLQWAATSDGLSLGYQVFGDGPVDLVIIPPFAQNIELAWERPELRRIWERTGTFARVVHFDKRGTGVSDRRVPVPGLDQRVDDARAVMDAAGVDRAVLYGISEGVRWRCCSLSRTRSASSGSCSMPPTRALSTATG